MVIKKGINEMMQMKKIILTVFFILFFLQTSSYAVTYEYYYYNSPTDYLLKRAIQDNGDIYEYLNETGYGYYGRVALIYKVSEGIYRTYDWTGIQVLIGEYHGIYNPAYGSGIRSDVLLSERRRTYLYDHHGQMQNLDTQTNGWTMRLKTDFQNDGTTLKEQYEYNASGIMTRHSIYDSTGNLTYEYLYDDSGRLIREDRVAQNIYYIYTYIGSAASPRYKDEYERSTNTLFNMFEFVGDDFTIQKNTSGYIFTLKKIDSSWFVNTFLAQDGLVSHYKYDANQALQGITKYYGDGTIDKLNGQGQMLEKIGPATSFVKGANLPWLDYGHDLGSLNSGLGYSVDDHKKDLINKMGQFAGGTVRVFLFTDLRDVIDFSGPSLRFYDQDKLYKDMDGLLEAAAISGTKIIPVFFDYWLAYGSASGDTGHPDVIKDPAKRDQLISLIATFVDHYKNNDKIAMWDLMNEPYYGTSASPWGDQDPNNPTMSTVSVEEMRAFLNGLLTAVQTNDPTKDITIGFANKEIMNQYWSSFIDGGADDIDVIQIHYWGKYYNYNFNELDFPANDAIFNGKPVLLGEIDPQYYNTSVDPDFTARLNMIFGAGYVGGLFWQGDGYTQPITPADMERLQNWYYGTKYEYYVPSGNLKKASFPEGNIYEYQDNDYDGDDRTGRMYKHTLPNGIYYISPNDSDFVLDHDLIRRQEKHLSDGTLVNYQIFTYNGWYLTRRDTYDPSDNLIEYYLFTAHYPDYSIKTQERYNAAGVKLGTYVIDEYYMDLFGFDMLVFRQTEYDGNGNFVGKYRFYYYPNSDLIETQEIYNQDDIYQEKFVYEYFANTDVVQFKTKYDAGGALVVKYEYNAQSRLIKETHADGTYKIFEYYGTADRVYYAREYDSAGNLLIVYFYYDDATNRLNLKDVVAEHDPNGNGTHDENPADTAHEFYNKHIKYYYLNENHAQDPITGSWYGRVNRIDNVTDSYAYQLTYYSSVSQPLVYNTKTKRVLNGDGTLGATIEIFYYFGNTTNRLNIKEVMNETGVPSTSEFYNKHVKYYYLDENHVQDSSGSWYGRINRIDNVTDSYAYQLTYYSSVSQPLVYNTKTKRVLNGDGTLGATIEIFYYFGNTTNRLNIKEVMNETGVPSTSEFYNKRIKYYYLDENHLQDSSGSWYGRVNRIDNVTDSYGYEFTYYTAAGVIPQRYATKVKKRLSDGSILESYAYFSNATNRLNIKEVMHEYDPNGNGTPNENPADTTHEFYNKRIKYYYLDENHVQDSSGSWYGRIRRIDNITDSYGYEFTYYTAAGVIPQRYATKVKKRLSDGSILESYAYFSNAANRLNIKEIMKETDPNGNGIPNENPADTTHEFYNKRIKYYYLDESYKQAMDGSWYGRINRIDNITNSYAYQITYYSSAGQPIIYNTKTKRVRNSDGTLGATIETYYYYNNSANRLAWKTLATPDNGGNIYYHYIDENWNSQGYGRIDKSKRQTAVNGELSHAYTYYADSTGRLYQKTAYSDSNWSVTLIVHRFYNENFNNTGVGRLREKLIQEKENGVWGWKKYTYNAYWSNTDLAAVIKKYNSSGTLLETYNQYYNASKRLEGFKKYNANGSRIQTVWWFNQYPSVYIRYNSTTFKVDNPRVMYFYDSTAGAWKWCVSQVVDPAKDPWTVAVNYYFTSKPTIYKDSARTQTIPYSETTGVFATPLPPPMAWAEPIGTTSTSDQLIKTDTSSFQQSTSDQKEAEARLNVEGQLSQTYSDDLGYTLSPNLANQTKQQELLNK